MYFWWGHILFYGSPTRNYIGGTDSRRDGDYVYQNKIPKENQLDKEYCYLIENDGKNFSLMADLENKSDVECQKDKWQCGGQKYCYRHLLSAEILK